MTTNAMEDKAPLYTPTKESSDSSSRMLGSDADGIEPGPPPLPSDTDDVDAVGASLSEVKLSTADEKESTLERSMDFSELDLNDLEMTGKNALHPLAHSLPAFSKGNREDATKSWTTVPLPPTSENNDPYLQNPEAQAMTRNLAMEHRIFLRAILDLLAERDQHAICGLIHDPRTIKIGSLKKASRRIKGLWKTKYVEIRKGLFSYFDDRGKRRRGPDEPADKLGGDRLSLRKDIPLRSSSCTCRAVKICSINIRPIRFGNGAVFELRIQGGSRRLWMASTRDDRRAWIQAIHNAMIGASVTRGDNFMEYQVERDDRRYWKRNEKVTFTSPYKAFLEQYLDVRTAANRAQSKVEYLEALSSLRGKSITVPVQWIKSQLDNTPEASAFLETDISSGVEQLWKDLLRDSVEINGEVLYGESFHGPDRIVGKLMHQILSTDRSRYRKGNVSCSDREQNRITEAQAISYARDILSASDRTRSGGDSYYCAENLCLNRNLVVICPSCTEANPLSISVCVTEGDETSRQVCSSSHDSNDISGWVSTRRSSSEPWSREFLVLSQNVLSCYTDAGAERLSQDQVLLTGAKISVSSYSKQHSLYAGVQPSTRLFAWQVVRVTEKDTNLIKDLLFENEFDFLLWKDSLSNSAYLSGACKNSNVDMRGDARQRSVDESSEILNAKNSFSALAVDVVVNVSTEYKMCTLDPQGIESEDTWA